MHGMSNVRDLMKETGENFARSVTEHRLTIIRDDGLYRHLRFKRPNTISYYFDIITWPGFLAYVGDMGDYLFCRIEDMFTFFRGERPNPSYWAEKVRAEDRNSKVFGFSRDRFEAALKEEFESFWKSHGVDDQAKTEAWEDIEAQVLEGDETVADAVARAHEFEYEGQQVFVDFWENRLEDYTWRFMWCCHALPWAIARYEEAKTASAAEGEVA